MPGFKLAPVVEPDGVIRSTERNDLARAFNDRLRSGAGDAVWRIFWNAYSLTRLVRNPEGDFLLPGGGAWPATDEWLKFYAKVSAGTTCGSTADAFFWPTSPPGQPFGANVTNPLMLFVFGQEPNIYGEAARLTDGPTTSGDEPRPFEPVDVINPPNPVSEDSWTDAFWTGAIQQRGYIAADTQAFVSPAYTAARSFYSVRYGRSNTPYLANYTCYAPVPQATGLCQYVGGTLPRRRRVFTALVPGYVNLAFDSCPGISGSLTSVLRLDDRYRLIFQDAGFIDLPYPIYMEGPFTGGGGTMDREHSELVTMALNRLVAGMRGTPDQLANACFDPAAGFDFQRFLSSQYPLAPAVLATTPASLAAIEYPGFKKEFTGSQAKDLELGAYTPKLPYSAVSAFYVRTTNVASPARIGLFDAAGNPIPLFAQPDPCLPAVPTDFYLEVPAGTASQATRSRMLFLAQPWQGEVKIRLLNDVDAMTGRTATIHVEVLDQALYRPDVQDAYLVSRLGFTTGRDDGPDTLPETISQLILREYSQNFFKYGGIYNQSATNIPQHETAANFNSVVEAARRLVNDNVRLVPRDAFFAVRTNAEGNTELYFQRHITGSGGDDQLQFNEEEVASREVTTNAGAMQPSELRENVEYVVRKDVLETLTGSLVASVFQSQEPNKMGRHPLEVYAGSEPDCFCGDPNLTYCDDFVLYANDKYVPPGYPYAVRPDRAGNDWTAVGYSPSDGPERHARIIIGRNPATVTLSTTTGTDAAGAELHRSLNNAFTREVTHIDSLGNPQVSVIRARRLYWVHRSRQRNGSGDWEYVFINRLPHRRGVSSDGPVSQGGQQVGGTQDQGTLGNGWRYVVERRIRASDQGDWGSWQPVAVNPGTGTDGTQATYGYDPFYLQPDDTGTRARPGAYFFEDRENLQLADNLVEYRILGRPVIDRNHDRMQVLQRAYHNPRQISWAASPGSGGTRLTYVVEREKGAEWIAVTLPVSVTTAQQVHAIDNLADLCPVKVSGWNHLTQTGTYTTTGADPVGRYRLRTITETTGAGGAVTSTSELTPVVLPVQFRPISIRPVTDGELFGVNTDTSGCAWLTDLVYRVRGNTFADGRSPYLLVKRPNHPDGDLEVPINGVFRWRELQPNPAGGIDTSLNYQVERWVKVTVGSTVTKRQAASFEEQVQVYQDALLRANDCAPETDSTLTIANTAGLVRGEFLGGYALPAAGNLNDLWLLTRDNEIAEGAALPDMLDRPRTPADWNTGYQGGNPGRTVNPANGFRPSRWTPWDNENDSTFGLTEVQPWYILRTGLERAFVVTLFAPDAGPFEVRGTGYIEYVPADGTAKTRAFSGNTISFRPNDLSYTASDASMKLVRVTRRTCSSTNFEHFLGLAPVTADPVFMVGRKYYPFLAAGGNATFQITRTNNQTPVTRPVNVEFTWEADWVGIASGAPTGLTFRPVEGIIRPGGQLSEERSNEWVMFITLNHYHWSRNSIWKPELYGDQQGMMHNRCHTGSFEFRRPKHPQLQDHFAYGSDWALLSEAPPGYTYADGTNNPVGLWDGNDAAAVNARRAYYRSCQVYRAPYEVLSAQIHYQDQTNGRKSDDVVKIVLKGRLQRAAGSPASFNSPDGDVAGGKIKQSAASSLAAEGWRSDENGLREYVIHQATGGLNDGAFQCPPGRIGDSAGTYDIFSIADNPFGACHPRFHFLKLVPLVREDGNDVVDVDPSGPMDTPLRVDEFMQMDLYLRAMCGGFLDQQSLRGAGCDMGFAQSIAGDYLYRNLCYQACRTNGTFLPVIPSVFSESVIPPFEVLAEYSFTYPAGLNDTPVVLEYQVWDPLSCAFGPWIRLTNQPSGTGDGGQVGGDGYTQVAVDFTGARTDNHAPPDVVVEIGRLEVSSVRIDAGGGGYAVPPIVRFSGGGLPDGDPGHATGTATLGDFGGISEIIVTDGGAGYPPDTWVDLKENNQPHGAAATVEVDNGRIVAVTVLNQGSGYTSTGAQAIFRDADGNEVNGGAAVTIVVGVKAVSAVTVTNGGAYRVPPVVHLDPADGDSGSGALATPLTNPLPGAGPIRSITVTNPYTNFGFLEPPGVTIRNTGASSGQGAFAVADTVIDSGSNSLRVTAVRLVPAPSGRPPQVTLAFPQGAAYPVNFRFSDARLWNGDQPPDEGQFLTGVTWTSVLGVTLDFLRGNGHSYSLVHQDLKFGRCEQGFSASLADWTFTPIPTPLCPANEFNSSDSGCGEACACLHVDNSSRNVLFKGTSPPGANDIVGRAYFLSDAGAQEVQAYALTWLMNARTAYDVQRRFHYVFGWGEWRTIASDVRPIYVDRLPPETSFSRTLEAAVEYGEVFKASATFNYPTDSPFDGSPRIFSVDLAAKELHGTLLVDCLMSVQNGGETREVEVPRLAVPASADSVTVTDDRNFSGLLVDGDEITRLVYTASLVGRVTVTWTNLPDHERLVAHAAAIKFSYKLYREATWLTTLGVAPDGQAGLEMNDLLAQSGIENAVSPDWNLNPAAKETVVMLEQSMLPDGLARLMDWRTLVDPLPVDGQLGRERPITSERYYVVVSWEAAPVTTTYTVPGECGGEGASVTSDRQYRVEARADARQRSFTAMPVAVNYNRPEGFGPVPSTCAYAELFNNFSRAVNLLTACRLDLPFTRRTRFGSSFWSVNDGADCTDRVNLCNFIAPVTLCDRTSGGSISWSDWESAPETVGAGANSGVNFGNFAPTEAACNFNVGYGGRVDVTEVSVDLNGEYVDAIPSSLLGNLAGLRTAGFGWSTTRRTTYRAVVEPSSDANMGCQLPFEPMCPMKAGNGLVYNFAVSETVITECVSFSGGRVGPPGGGCGDAAWVGCRGGTQETSVNSHGGAGSNVVIEGLRTMAFLSFPLY
jgi:hypothetical protein